MKRALRVVLVVLAAFLLSSGTAWASSEISIKVNGVGLSTEIPPLIVSNRTMVPMRSISEALGADVVWDQKNQTVILEKSDTIIRLPIGSSVATKNDHPVRLDVPAMVIEGRTLVPARFISEAFGADVTWDNPTRAVLIAAQETRAGKSALDIFNTATASNDALSSYKFNGSIKMAMFAAPSAVATINIETAVYGAFKTPQEVYSKTSIVSSNFDIDLGDSETFTNGTNYYEKVGDRWEKLESSGPNQLLDGGAFDNPTTILSMPGSIKKVAAFGNDALVAGKPHYTIYLKLDPDDYKAELRNTISKLGPDDLSADEKALAERNYDELLKGLRFDAVYKVFIDKATLVADYVEMRSITKMSVEGQGLTTTSSSGSFTIFAINQPVEMPVVK
ncbi:MAG TPA: copper amine oxidase N-terminal domain-containing protein [Candidatus Aquicultor sp.]